ncbi:MAG TPA: DUF58 domain-containing protein [Firmicutes bacterium]|nr:DUF58 domain-containing protein [Bacillota bacterium]
MPAGREVIKKIKRVRIKTQRLVDTLLAGEYASAFQGQGIEFSEVRPYDEGDDVRTIDWNVTARMNAPYVKKYIEERELKIYLLVDISPSNEFGTEGGLKRELVTEFAATLAWLGISRNDKVGIVLFGNKVEKSLPPKKGKRQLARIIENLLYLQPSETLTAITPAIAWLGRIAKRRAVVFIISDFMTDENLSRPLKVLSIRHDVVLVRLSDRWERDLPNVGMVEIEDPETGDVLLVDTSDPFVRKSYRELRERHHASFNRARNQAGLDLIDISTGEPFIPPLMSFLRRRRTRRRHRTH